LAIGLWIYSGSAVIAVANRTRTADPRPLVS